MPFKPTSPEIGQEYIPQDVSLDTFNITSVTINIVSRRPVLIIEWEEGIQRGQEFIRIKQKSHTIAQKAKINQILNKDVTPGRKFLKELEENIFDELVAEGLIPAGTVQ